MFDESPESENKEESAKDGKDGGNVSGARRMGRGPCLQKDISHKRWQKKISSVELYRGTVPDNWGSYVAANMLIARPKFPPYLVGYWKGLSVDEGNWEGIISVM